MAKILTEKPAIEYIDGRPYRKLSPKRTHGVVQLALATVLKRCADRRGSIAPEWRFRLAAGTELVPDVAYVSYERLRALGAPDREEPPFAPDIAAEVRSPSHRHALASEKITLYLRYGSALVLDVDAFARVVHAYTPDGERASYRPGECVRCAALPWLDFDPAQIFSDIDIPD